MRTTSALKAFVPAPEVEPDEAMLLAHASRYWAGMPFAWQEEFEEWKKHSRKVGQVLTQEGLELWLDRVLRRQCPIAGEGCSPAILMSRFCKFHFDRLSER